jgi:hypothetical protein
MNEERAQACIVLADPKLLGQRRRIADLAFKDGLPSIYGIPEHVDAGGLMSYAAGRLDVFRRAAVYVDKILGWCARTSLASIRCAACLCGRDVMRLAIEPIGKVITMIVVPVITAVTGYFVYLQNTKLNEQKIKLEALDSELRRRASERADLESQQKFNFQIYEAVKASLSQDAQHQEAARVLVVSIATEPLKSALLDALASFKGLDSGVKERVKEDLYQAQQAIVFTPSQKASESADRGFKWEDWDYDVFWCEQSGAPARAQAEAILAAMKRQGAAGRLRVRPLAQVINDRPGYGIRGYVIRRDTGEEKQAEALQQLAEKTLRMPGKFTVEPSGQATRWYLSAFVCPG